MTGTLSPRLSFDAATDTLYATKPAGVSKSNTAGD
jgi:hypothetical protein